MANTRLVLFLLHCDFFLWWSCIFCCFNDIFMPFLLQLKVGPVDGKHRDYQPGKNLRLQVKGDPGAKVSLVAVDNAVYLLNKERLTQRKVCIYLYLRTWDSNRDIHVKFVTLLWCISISFVGIKAKMTNDNTNGHLSLSACFQSFPMCANSEH